MFDFIRDGVKQRWSPRGHILKSLALALASKVKSLASRPQVLENWPVLGSRTALIFELLKFCGALEKFFEKRFFVEIARKIFVKTFFFWRWSEKFLWRLFFFFFWRALALVFLVLGLGLEHSCPWPRECLSSERLSLALASDFFCVLGFGLGLRFFLCPWPWPRALCPRLHLWCEASTLSCRQVSRWQLDFKTYKVLFAVSWPK